MDARWHATWWDNCESSKPLVQARTAFGAFDPSIIIIKSVVFSLKSVLSFVNFYGILNIKDFYPD